MKKLFFLTAFVLSVLGMNAQQIIFSENIAAGEMNGKVFGQGFTLTCTDEAGRMAVDENNCYFGDANNQVKFDHRLKSGGKSLTTEGKANNMKLNAPAAGKLYIYARTGSNSATDRNVSVSQYGSELINQVLLESDAIEVVGLDSKEPEKMTKVYPVLSCDVVAGDIEIAYPVGSVNFYGFSLGAEITPEEPIGGKAGDNIQWSLKDGVLTLEGTGAMYDDYDYYSNYAPWYSRRDSIREVRIPEGITTIGRYAFYDCENVLTIEIPSTMQYIGWGAFSNCYSLKALYATCGGDAYDRVYNLVYNNNYDYARYVAYKPLPYKINAYGNHGTVYYPGTICSDMILTAEPDYGYMFERWSDGNTDNPRAFTLTQDTTFVAEFKQYLTTVKIGDWKYELNLIDKTATLIGKSASIEINDNSVADWNDIPAEYVAEATCPSGALWTGLKKIKVYANQEYINYMLEFDPQSMPRHTSADGMHIYINADNSNETGGYWDLFAPERLGDVDLMFEGVLWDEGGNEQSYYPTVAKWGGELHGEGWNWDFMYSSYFGGGTQFVGNNIIEGRLKISEIPWNNWSDKFGIGFDIQQNWGNVGLLPQANSPDGEKIGRDYKLEVTFDPQDPYEVRGAVTIPASVTYQREAYTVIAIGERALENCVSMTSLTIPSSVRSIGRDAFDYCINLDTVILPSTLEYVDNSAFSRCYKISYFEGPLMAFSNMSQRNLKAVIINGGETENLGNYWMGDLVVKLDLAAVETSTLPNYWLSDHRQLEELILPAHLQKIGYMSLGACMELKEITIPATVVEIDKRAFEDCRSLAKLTFERGSRLESIGDWAFYNCHELAQLDIPEGVTEIGKAAFYGCTYLQNVTLPASMRVLGDNAFALCSKMQKMTVKAIVPPTIEAKTFEEVSRQMPVYVPIESVEAYTSHPFWGQLNIMGAPQGIDNTFVPQTSGKFLRDGQLLILRGDKIYTTFGQEVR